MSPYRRPRVLPPEVARRLGPYYVYILVDPRDECPFYVGKGTRERLLEHGIEADLRKGPGESAKVRRIREIRREGLEPRVDIVRHQISEHQAFLIEAALIDCLRPPTNKVSGHGVERGRAPLEELVTRYGAPRLEATNPHVLMIRLTPRWVDDPEKMEPGYDRMRYGWGPEATPTELFDSVRGWWKVNPERLHRRGIRHVVAVAEGVTRGVYEIERWYQRADRRWAFTGRRIARGKLWEAYVGEWGKRVPFAGHSQNPLIYWPTAERAGR